MEKLATKFYLHSSKPLRSYSMISVQLLELRFCCEKKEKIQLGAKNERNFQQYLVSLVQRTSARKCREKKQKVNCSI